jgi:hypothetical protein
LRKIQEQESRIKSAAACNGGKIYKILGVLQDIFVRLNLGGRTAFAPG